jgi:hypothetical protein
MRKGVGSVYDKGNNPWSFVTQIFHNVKMSCRKFSQSKSEICGRVDGQIDEGIP